MENNHNDKLVRLETLLEIMNQKIDELTINYKDLPNRLTRLEVENSQQQKEIDELKQNAKDTKKMDMGYYINNCWWYSCCCFKIFYWNLIKRNGIAYHFFFSFS